MVLGVRVMTRQIGERRPNGVNRTWRMIIGQQSRMSIIWRRWRKSRPCALVIVGGKWVNDKSWWKTVISRAAHGVGIIGHLLIMISFGAGASGASSRILSCHRHRGSGRRVWRSAATSRCGHRAQAAGISAWLRCVNIINEQRKRLAWYSSATGSERRVARHEEYSNARRRWNMLASAFGAQKNRRRIWNGRSRQASWAR